MSELKCLLHNWAIIGCIEIQIFLVLFVRKTLRISKIMWSIVINLLRICLLCKNTFLQHSLFAEIISHNSCSNYNWLYSNSFCLQKIHTILFMVNKPAKYYFFISRKKTRMNYHSLYFCRHLYHFLQLSILLRNC